MMKEQEDSLKELKIPEFLCNNSNCSETERSSRFLYSADEDVWFDEDEFQEEDSLLFKIQDLISYLWDSLCEKFHKKPKVETESVVDRELYKLNLERDRDKYIGQKILNLNVDGKPNFYRFKSVTCDSPIYDISNKKILDAGKYIDIQIGDNHINYYYQPCHNWSTYTVMPFGKLSSEIFCNGKWRNLNYTYQEVIGAVVTDIRYTEIEATEKPYEGYESPYGTYYSNAVDELEIFLDNGKKIVIYHTKETATFSVINSDETPDVADYFYKNMPYSYYGKPL